MRKFEFDLIHAHHYEGLFLANILRRWIKKPIIYDAHTILASELPVYNLGLSYRMKQSIGKKLDRWLPPKADFIVAVSSEIRNYITDCTGYPSSNITVIPNGVNSEHFEVNSQENQFFKNGEKILVYAGTLAPYQRIDLLLKAFSEVVNERQDVRLLIISDSSFEKYEPLAQSLGIRKYLTITQADFKDLPKILSGADIALNPRVVCDGIPQKILNYMAAGKPIVSFNGSSKFLKHEETAIIVKDESISEFTEAILTLLNDSQTAKRLGDNARLDVQNKFSWDKIAGQVEQVYDSILIR